ncbi:unnamed protein product [Euphydryas editha]|uniref:Uncharacterized protein n=1 Tax=Euphydryas editha TaxID=104508 RepID=A0AAU9VFA9_EUPED|nr:unnamed protein product [Euphydryas editha]
MARVVIASLASSAREAAARRRRGASRGAWPRTDWPPHANASRRLRARNHRTTIATIVRGKNSARLVCREHAPAKNGMRITRNCKNGRRSLFICDLCPSRRTRLSRLIPRCPRSRDFFHSAKTRRTATEPGDIRRSLDEMNKCNVAVADVAKQELLVTLLGEFFDY